MFFQVANLYSTYYRFFKHMLQFCYKITGVVIVRSFALIWKMNVVNSEVAR